MYRCRAPLDILPSSYYPSAARMMTTIAAGITHPAEKHAARVSVHPRYITPSRHRRRARSTGNVDIMCYHAIPQSRPGPHCLTAHAPPLTNHRDHGFNKNSRLPSIATSKTSPIRNASAVRRCMRRKQFGASRPCVVPLGRGSAGRSTSGLPRRLGRFGRFRGGRLSTAQIIQAKGDRTLKIE